MKRGVKGSAFGTSMRFKRPYSAVYNIGAKVTKHLSKDYNIRISQTRDLRGKENNYL